MTVLGRRLPGGSGVTLSGTPQPPHLHGQFSNVPSVRGERKAQAEENKKTRTQQLEQLWPEIRKKPKKGQAVGDVRELVGLLTGLPDSIEGRTNVMEWTNQQGKPHAQMRQVDNRTIMELKCNGIHYTVTR
jgi:hypothetical protein